VIGAPHWLAEAVSYSGGGWAAALSSKLGPKHYGILVWMIQ